MRDQRDTDGVPHRPGWSSRRHVPGRAARSTITRCPAGSTPRWPWAREQPCSPSSSRSSRSGYAAKTSGTARWRC